MDYLKNNPQIGYDTRVENDINKAINSDEIDTLVIQSHIKEQPEFAKIFYRLLTSKIAVIDLITFYEIIFQKLPLDEIEEGWFIEKITTRKIFYDFIKRVIGIFLSITSAVIFLPFFIVIAILTKLSSRQGPVIFKQERIGLSRKKFTFWKFRSMYVNSNSEIHRSYVEQLIKNGSPNDPTATQEHEKTYKITNDPRVTPVGKFLRKTSIDELPQLINVLKGEMSLVGPRPPIPYELWSYDIWHKRRVLDIKPGITGLWQVKGRSRTTFDEMVRLDLKYIREWSLWLDIKILLQTPWAVFSSKGAY